MVNPRMKLIEGAPVDKLRWFWLAENPTTSLLGAVPKPIYLSDFTCKPTMYEIDKKQFRIDVEELAGIIDGLIRW
jgi:hypothetical protein